MFGNFILYDFGETNSAKFPEAFHIENYFFRMKFEIFSYTYLILKITLETSSIVIHEQL